MATAVKTTIDFPAVDGFRTMAKDDEKSQLVITTDKGYRDGIDVSARVQGHDGTFITISSSDFRITVANFPAKRVTQKRLDAIHAETVSDELIESVKGVAFAYYSEQVALKAQRGY